MKKYRVTIDMLSLRFIDNTASVMTLAKDSVVLMVVEEMNTLSKVFIVKSDVAPILAEGVGGKVEEIEPT